MKEGEGEDSERFGEKLILQIQKKVNLSQGENEQSGENQDEGKNKVITQ